MLEAIKYLIATPLAAVFIAEWSGVMDVIKHKIFYRSFTRKTRYVPFSLKPFDCAMCLSFWLTAIQIAVLREYNLFLYPFAAATVGAFISKL